MTFFACRCVAFDESKKLGRFDVALLDDGHAFTQKMCGAYATVHPINNSYFKGFHNKSYLNPRNTTSQSS
jgi:hypothetical protein